MKEIGILEFEQLVMARLTSPRDYARRSLVLWNADYMDYGIAYRVIKQCCERYNKENPNDHVWFKRSDMTFYKDDYTQPKTSCVDRGKHWNRFLNKYVYGERVELKRCGIIFNTGCYRLELQCDWLKFVNTHTNQNGGVFQDCAVIVCAQAGGMSYFGPSNPKYNLKEEQFGEYCDIYHIQPTIEEWAKWAEQFYGSEIIKVVRAYIEKNGVGVIRGFDYWMRVMVELVSILEKHKVRSLRQIPASEVSSEIGCCGWITVEHPDFCKFIYSFLEDNPSKE